MTRLKEVLFKILSFPSCPPSNLCEPCEQRVEETFSAHALVAVSLVSSGIFVLAHHGRVAPVPSVLQGELPTNQDGYKHTGLSKGPGLALSLL